MNEPTPHILLYFKMKNLHVSMSFLMETKITKRRKKGGREDPNEVSQTSPVRFW